MSYSICKLDECDSTIKGSRGYCAMHYQRLMKYGDPRAGRTKYATWQEALKGRSEWRGDCLVWTGSVNQHGYGRARDQDGKLRVVHHLAWEQAHGPVPSGLEIDHTCFNRACINVDHLRAVTRSDNARHRQGAQPNSRSGVRNVHAYSGGRWQVRLKVSGRHVHYGVYDTIPEAEAVAIRARRELFNRP